VSKELLFRNLPEMFRYEINKLDVELRKEFKKP